MFFLFCFVFVFLNRHVVVVAQGDCSSCLNTKGYPGCAVCILDQCATDCNDFFDNCNDYCDCIYGACGGIPPLPSLPGINGRAPAPPQPKTPKQ